MSPVLGVRAWLVPAVAVGALYYLAGRLALLLAIPPGYATAVWPAAGVALAAVLLAGPRIWPGVLAGSFLLNVWTSLEPGDPASVVRSVIIAGAIGAGAAAQALSGAVLVRRLVGYPTALDDESTVVRFLLAAPLGCVVSATVGVTALWGAGVIGGSESGFSWWTWWVGDTIGVVIVTPLALLWAERREAHQARRRLAVAVPLAAVVVLAVVFFVSASRWEQERIGQEFERRAGTLVNALRDELGRHVEVLHGIAGLYRVTPRLDAATFRSFVADTVGRHPGLLAVSWDERVFGADRSIWEARWRTDTPGAGVISERSESGAMVPAVTRPEYVVVAYIHPLAGNERALGFNVASDAVRLEALHRARDSGRATASAPLVLVQDASPQRGILVMLPVYRPAAAAGTLDERRRALAGYATGVLRISRLVEAVLQAVRIDGITFEIEDSAARAEDRVLYRGDRLSADGRRSPLTWAMGLDVAGRPWRVSFSATPGYVLAQRSWQAWVVLAGGLVFAALLEGFLLVVTGRAARVERLVAVRTADLQREIAERTRAQSLLASSETRFRGLLESAPDAMVIVDAAGRIVLVNAQAERLFGYRRDELLGRPVEILMPERYRDSHLGHRAAYVAAPTARPMGAGFRLSARTRDGGEFPVEISLSPLETEDETLTIAGIRDVSERRRAEERLVTSLKEKETLLTEVHHRVKNNLQIVSSLMNLASAPITDPTARGVFRTSRHRIHAMAAIHDRLYRSQSFGRVDAGEYVTSLAGDLLRSYELAPARVALTTDVHHVLLSLDTAIPCGLIVNELVSNALEHAFPPPGRGTIHVGLREAPPGVCIVQVRDDGIGFPDDFDLQQVTSVGLRLVVALARQLGGTVSVQRAPGAEFTIRFPLEQEAVAPSAEGEGAGPA